MLPCSKKEEISIKNHKQNSYGNKILGARVWKKKKRLQVLVLDTKYKISTLKETMKTKTKN